MYNKPKVIEVGGLLHLETHEMTMWIRGSIELGSLWVFKTWGKPEGRKPAHVKICWSLGVYP